MEYDSPQIWDINNYGEDSISVEKFGWGIFDILKCKALYQNQTATSRLVIGNERSTISQSAIYAVDHKTSIQMVGEARIFGDAYLPTAGIKPDYINRQGYTGEKLVFGDIKESSTDIPSFTVASKIENNKQRLLINSKTIFLNDEEYVQNLVSQDSIYFIKCNDLSINKDLRGFVFIESIGRVTIESDAKLENVIISAKSILIENGFIGQGQFLASESITLENNVSLSFPSVALLMSDSGRINLNEGATIEGLVALSGDGEIRDKKLIIAIGSKITGMVYCNGTILSSGIINGHTTSDYFEYQNASGVYINYIYNSVYDSNIKTFNLVPFDWHSNIHNHGIIKRLE